MATASTNSPNNDELSRDIAPAMLAKLRRDGRGKGLAIGLQVVFLTMLVNRQIGDTESITQPMPIMVALSVVAMGALILLPLYMRKNELSSEFAYRRQHGKWRWER
jgi:hypothetical protein